MLVKHDYYSALSDRVYKRNQIEEAIGRMFDRNCNKPPSELRTRIKRLLELDRSMRRKVRLTAIAESRHNSSLREIDRRRPVLGESVQKIEDGELK